MVGSIGRDGVWDIHVWSTGSVSCAIWRADTVLLELI